MSIIRGFSRLSQFSSRFQTIHKTCCFKFSIKVEQTHRNQIVPVQFQCKFNIFQYGKRMYSSAKAESSYSYTMLFKNFIANGKPEKVLDRVKEMKIEPDEYILGMIFHACAQVNNDEAKNIGIKLLDKMSERFHANPILLTTALKMLMSFGDINRAEKLFQSMKMPNVFNYGVMVKGYIENNLNEKALDLFKKMSVKPDDVIYTLVLKACVKLNDDPCFGDFDRAEQLFKSKKHEQDSITYGAIIKGYVNYDMNDKALNLFEEMRMKLNEMVITNVFKACAQLNNERAEKIGMKLLNQILKSSQKSDIVLNSAIHMLMSLGKIESAENLFSLLKKKDIVSYGALMSGYVENDQNDKALNLFEETLVKSDEKIYSIVFKACMKIDNERGRNIGMQLVHKIINEKVTNEITLTSAINMLVSFGQVDRAEQLFRSIQRKSVLVYTVMMSGYANNDQLLKCKQCFEQMKQESSFSKVDIYASILRICAQIASPSFYQRIADEIPVDLYNNLQVLTGQIDVLGKIGEVEKAEKIFQSIANPDITTYNNMINTYALNGQGLDAIKLYEEISADLLNEYSHIAVLNGCSHAGLLNEARVIFNNIKNKTHRIYTTMIDCLSRLQMFDEAEQLIQEYEQHSKRSCPPMYMSLLSGVRIARRSDLSSKIYKRMEEVLANHKEVLIAGAILVENIHRSIGDVEQASNIRQYRIKNHGSKRTPGISQTDYDGEIVSFTAHDQSHPLIDEILAEVKFQAKEIREQGHQFDASWITRPLKEDETTESVLCGHSERLAIAYNFIHGRKPSKIFIKNNLRMCGDCHNATKLIAKIHNCEIIVRDANRMHRFTPNGQCSCCDHF